MNNNGGRISGLVDSFRRVNDPGVKGRTSHELPAIIVIAVCAVITGAEGREDMESFGKVHEKWLSGFLELRNGIPGHDTFRRVFERIDPDGFAHAFLEWIEGIAERKEGVPPAIMEVRTGNSILISSE
jgi:hypothetical protein